jgi:hypothetical protein
MKNEFGYCDKCGKKRLLCRIHTESPSGSFSRDFKVCLSCIKLVEEYIKPKQVVEEEEEQMTL